MVEPPTRRKGRSTRRPRSRILISTSCFAYGGRGFKRLQSKPPHQNPGAVMALFFTF